MLEGELASHADAVNNRVDEVQSEVDRFKADMEEYFDRLSNEEDPSRLATMVEAMPDPPSFDAWADLGSTRRPRARRRGPVDEAPRPTSRRGRREVEAGSRRCRGRRGRASRRRRSRGRVDGRPAVEAAAETPPPSSGRRRGRADEAESTSTPRPTTTTDEAAAKPAASRSPGARATATGVAPATPAERRRPALGRRRGPGGFPTGAEGGDPVDRGAIMAALEAAAEAVVAAEAAADSADQAEAAADVAETAAELVVGRNSAEDGSLDPEAQAALDARVDAGGFEESYTDRLAHLLPARRGRRRRRAADHAGRRLGPRLRRQHRELQATPRPARRRAGASPSRPAPKASSCST